MNRIILSLIVALGLAGCSATNSAKFQSDIANLTANVAAVNGAIAQVSASLAQNCNAIATTAQALVPFAKIGSNAAGDLAAANAVIVTWCQAPPTDIPSAVKVTAAAVNSAKAAYAAAKAGN